MKQKLFTLLTLLCLCVTGAWAQDFTYALSSFTVTNTTYTYEFSSENGLKNKTVWVEVPSSNSEGTITFKGSNNKSDRFLYIYGTNGTVKDETRKIVMNTSWPTAIAFSSSDIKTSGEKFYLVFSTSDDFKTKGVKYTLTDPSGLEISPASGVYVGKASVTMSAKDGYTIYYTDNGTEPTKSSTVYTGTFDVTSNKTIKAIAYKGEDYGFVQTAEYIIVPENRTYDFTALTAEDLTALQDNTDAFSDNTTDKIISNKETWANNTEHAFEGSDGTDISVAQYLLFGRSGSGTSAGNVRYYYGDNKYIYFNNSNCFVKIPAVKAGQKVILEMRGSSNATITGTNTTESSKDYTASSKTKLTFFASADGTVTLTSNKAFFIYSIEVKTPVYYTVEYDLNGGTGTLPTETDKEEGDKFDLHDGTTDITAPAGKIFSKWKDQDNNVFEGGAVYTMPAKNVSLTAQWVDYVVQHTITYAANGGSGTMTETKVVDGEDQTLPANTFTRDCYAFSHWTADVDVTVGGSIITAGNAIADEATIQNVTGDITLTAQWTPVYSTSLDFAAVTLAKINDNIDPPAIATFLAGGNVVAENLGSSAWETGSGWGSTIKTGFLGYKLKNQGAKVSFLAPAGKLVTIVLGSVGASVTLSKNGATSSIGENSGDDAETIVTPFVTDADMLVSLTTTKSSTVTLKKIIISDYATATISAAEYATFYNAEKALDFSTTGITVYTAQDKETSVGLTEITSGQVPANTPVVLYKAGANGTAINVPVIASAAAIEGTNDLRISTGTDVDNMYVLAMNPTIGFYPWTGTNLPAGKIYLQGKASYGARSFIGFDSNTTTSIDNVVVKTIDENAPMYNLAGQRVNKSYKGVVIVNGKKMLNK